MTFYPYGQPNYGNYVGYQQPNYQPQMSQQPIQTQQQQIQIPTMPKTNKIFVTSLEEAMNRSVEPNTVTIYLHQDLPLLFEVTNDAFGRKSSRTFDLLESKQKPAEATQGQVMPDLSDYVTKDEYKSVEGRLERIETILNNAKASTKKSAKEAEDKE